MQVIHHKCYMAHISQSVDHTSHDAYLKKASFDVSYRCDYSWHTATTPGTRLLLDRSVAGPKVGDYSCRTKSQHNEQAKHNFFYNFAERISFADHWKLVAESSEFHLTLSRAHRAHFSQLEIRKKKRNISSESGKAVWR